MSKEYWQDNSVSKMGIANRKQDLFLTIAIS